MTATVLKIEHVYKKYLLGEIGTGKLSHDLTEKGKLFWNKLINSKISGEENKPDMIWALKNINLEIKQGEILGIIGKNGSGKSTLLKLISRITHPTTGSIKTKGSIASLLEVGTGMHPEMTGRENIYLNGTILGMKRKAISRKFDEIVDFSECEKYIDTPVKRYSSGMGVRLGFAVAAFLETDILIVDEVLAVGDLRFQKKCLGKMNELVNGGRTVLFVSHNMSSIRNLCKSLIFLEAGSITYQGLVDEGINRYLRSNIDINAVSFHRKFEVKGKEIYVSEARLITGDNGHIEYVNDTIEVILKLIIKKKSHNLSFGHLA